ncbi:type II toxin-antitoxin system RelE/ParE family toxin [Rhizobium sp. SL86]|uniref:type II toxin-antitoxin system RelE/ParE family toxin n=1 Tax=Rhizobium sp. SL86 TaxID=2995148 RepID=UPI002275A78D|nr:type II toxin-antitoxin system RelE/ParE family toxin [Rhizobium sp. SL86]MCY1666030.1 type II toxin-antitoxin system RelE/ParE family toxin [Rhizobium sp. SL86]
MKLVWTMRYLNELEAIGDYVAQHDRRAAARLTKTIHQKTASLLTSNPFLGRAGEIDGTRELVISGTSYVVAYRVREDIVEVLFVQHGARQWPDEV